MMGMPFNADFNARKSDYTDLKPHDLSVTVQRPRPKGAAMIKASAREKLAA